MIFRYLSLLKIFLSIFVFNCFQVNIIVLLQCFEVLKKHKFTELYESNHSLNVLIKNKSLLGMLRNRIIILPQKTVRKRNLIVMKIYLIYIKHNYRMFNNLQYNNINGCILFLICVFII